MGVIVVQTVKPLCDVILAHQYAQKCQVCLGVKTGPASCKFPQMPGSNTLVDNQERLILIPSPTQP